MAGTPLGSYTAEMSPEQADAYLHDIRDPQSPVAALAAAHPGWLLRQANYILSRNVTLGPWIHVGSTIDLLRYKEAEIAQMGIGPVRFLPARRAADLPAAGEGTLALLALWSWLLWRDEDEGRRNLGRAGHSE